MEPAGKESPKVDADALPSEVPVGKRSPMIEALLLVVFSFVGLFVSDPLECASSAEVPRSWLESKG